MNAFESLAALLFERNGYWTISNYKVDLPKHVKKAVGRASAPRWDIDLLAYNVRDKVLLVIECKAYLDSNGVQYNDLVQGDKGSDRYKLFTDHKLRKEVFAVIASQLKSMGMIVESSKMKLCLLAAKIRPTDYHQIHEHFYQHEWELFDGNWIRHQLKLLSNESFSDNLPSVVSKLLLRASEGPDLKHLIIEIAPSNRLQGCITPLPEINPLLGIVESMGDVTEDGRHLSAVIVWIQKTSKARVYTKCRIDPSEIQLDNVDFHIRAKVKGSPKHKDRKQKQAYLTYETWEVK